MKRLRQEDGLDALMRDWAMRSAPDSTRLDELAQQIVAHDGVIPRAAGVPIESRHALRQRFRWVAYAGAIAASLIVVACFVQLFRYKSGNVDSMALTPFNARELAERARVAREFQAEFSGQFAWLVESDSMVKLGLTTEESTRPGRFIAVRFVVESQGPNEPVWRRVRVVEFVALAEETVRTSFPSKDGMNISLWMYPTPDGMISVESDFVLLSPVPIHASSSSLLSGGTAAEIWHAEEQGVKYRVFQMAELLDDDELG